MGMFKGLNTTRQGTLGAAYMMYVLVRKGWCVSVPLDDTQDYDLLASNNNSIYRIQVKSTQRIKHKHYVACLNTSRRKGPKKCISTNSSNYIAIVTDTEEAYLVPKEILGTRTSVAMNKNFDEYRITFDT